MKTFLFKVHLKSFSVQHLQRKRLLNVRFLISRCFRMLTIGIFLIVPGWRWISSILMTFTLGIRGRRWKGGSSQRGSTTVTRAMTSTCWDKRSTTRSSTNWQNRMKAKGYNSSWTTPKCWRTTSQKDSISSTRWATKICPNSSSKPLKPHSTKE